MFVTRDLDNVKSNIVATLINSWVPSHTFNNFSRASVISIGLHGQEQALGSAAGNIADTIVISVEQISRHPDDFVFDDSKGVEQKRIQGIIMKVFDEASFNSFGVLFGVLVNVGKCLTSSGANISFASFIKNR